MAPANRPDREPTLSEMLADPIVRILMLKDGVTETQIREAIGGAALRAHGLGPEMRRLAI